MSATCVVGRNILTSRPVHRPVAWVSMRWHAANSSANNISILNQTQCGCRTACGKRQWCEGWVPCYNPLGSSQQTDGRNTRCFHRMSNGAPSKLYYALWLLQLACGARMCMLSGAGGSRLGCHQTMQLLPALWSSPDVLVTRQASRIVCRGFVCFRTLVIALIYACMLRVPGWFHGLAAARGMLLARGAQSLCALRLTLSACQNGPVALFI
jgi:hypothetical protein